MMGIPKQGPVVAIDGPAGTGKSSTTKRLADLLGFTHIDTGALYRAIALSCIQKGVIDPTSQEAVSGDQGERASEIAKEAHIEFKRDRRRNPSNRVFLNGIDVTQDIRSPEVSMAASRVSAVPGVRAALLGLQRRLGCEGKTILEGRDIGTVIFPDADVKFFLTASLEERAKRRLAQMEVSGEDTPSFEELKHQIEIRDQGDQSRKVAPLKKAPDAIEIETTELTLDDVVSQMEKLVKQKLKDRS